MGGGNKDALKGSYLPLVIEPIVEKAHDVGLHGLHSKVVGLSCRHTTHSGVPAHVIRGEATDLIDGRLMLAEKRSWDKG